MPMVWGVLECLGNRGRLGLPTEGVGWRGGGARRHIRQEGWERTWWGGGQVGVGGQLGSQAAGRGRIRERLGWTVLTVCLGQGEKVEGLC